MIGIDLPNGATELLMTTLLDQHLFKTAQFNWLYQKRWTVETCFDCIKNKLMLSTFSAYRAHFVWQDIWATFIYHSVLSAYAQLARFVEAFRPKRSCPRKRKMMRINDRHQTEKNYKRAF